MTGPSTPPRSTVIVHLLTLVLMLTTLYEPWRLENTTGDNTSTRYWIAHVLATHTVSVDDFATATAEHQFGAVRRADGRWLPRTTWGVLPLALPVFAMGQVVFGDPAHWPHDLISRMSRLTAVVWALLAVLLLYWWLRRLVVPNVAWVAALLFGVGTWHWSMGAQGIGLQVACVLLFVVHLHLIWSLATAGPSERRWRTALLLGLVHGLVWSVRPQDMPLVLPAVLLLIPQRRWLPYAAMLAAIVIPLSLVYQQYYGSWVGLYGLGVTGSRLEAVYRVNPLPGVAGLLLSPNYGAIVFFPLIFLTPYLWWRLMPVPSIPALLRDAVGGDHAPLLRPLQRLSAVLAISCVAYFFSIAVLSFWHGAWAYGPRYLYNFQPYLWIPLALALDQLRIRLRGGRSTVPTWALSLLVLWNVQGVAVHALGHMNFSMYVWNFIHSPVDDAAAWDLHDWVITDTIRAGSNAHRWPDALTRLRTNSY